MPSRQSPSRMKCSLLRFVLSSSSSPARLLPVTLFAVGLREGRTAAHDNLGSSPRQSKAELAPRKEQNGRPKGGAQLALPGQITAAMTSHVSPDLVFSLEKFPGRLSCVKAQISALYRALSAFFFCTLVAEGCWGRKGCCPHTADFALPVLGQDKVSGRGTGVGLHTQSLLLQCCRWEPTNQLPRSSG